MNVEKSPPRSPLTGSVTHAGPFVGAMIASRSFGCHQVVDRRLGARRRDRPLRGAVGVAAARLLGQVEDQRVPVGFRRAGLELGMGVVEVDQVLERLRVAGAGVRLQVGGDVGLELAQQRRELGVGPVAERDVGRIDDGRAGGLERGDRVVHDRGDVRVDRDAVDLEAELAPDADPGAVERVRVEELGVVGECVAGLLGRRRIGGIDAGHRAQEHGGVGHVAGHRPGGVLVGRDRDDAGPAQEAERRLDAGVGVGARGADDRTVGLGAHGRDREVGRGDDARARARAAWVAIEDVGHVRLAADPAPAARRRPGAEVRPLRQVGLPDDERAGRPESLDDERVARACCRRAPRSRRSSACRSCRCCP